jgi:hypothetical protein
MQIYYVIWVSEMLFHLQQCFGHDWFFYFMLEEFQIRPVGKIIESAAGQPKTCVRQRIKPKYIFYLIAYINIYLD